MTSTWSADVAAGQASTDSVTQLARKSDRRSAISRESMPLRAKHEQRACYEAEAGGPERPDDEHGAGEEARSAECHESRARPPPELSSAAPRPAARRGCGTRTRRRLASRTRKSAPRHSWTSSAAASASSSSSSAATSPVTSRASSSAAASSRCASAVAGSGGRPWIASPARCSEYWRTGRTSSSVLVQLVRLGRDALEARERAGQIAPKSVERVRVLLAGDPGVRHGPLDDIGVDSAPWRGRRSARRLTSRPRCARTRSSGPKRVVQSAWARKSAPRLQRSSRSTRISSRGISSTR